LSRIKKSLWLVVFVSKKAVFDNILEDELFIADDNIGSYTRVSTQVKDVKLNNVVR